MDTRAGGPALGESVHISRVVVKNRIRQDHGDIDKLCLSIKEFGLIEPIVVRIISDDLVLVAGERRMQALVKLGYEFLVFGKDIVTKGMDHTTSLDNEKTKLFFSAMEMEENIRRKELTWQEHLEGKKRLLETMQKIYGKPVIGQPSRSESVHGELMGFGIRKLSAMLGESVGSTSRDLQIAGYMDKIPAIKNAATKESAFRQLKILNSVAEMAVAARDRKFEPKKYVWTLYEGDFRDNIHKIKDESVDLVYTDLPFGVGIGQMSKHAKGVVDYRDSRKDIVDALLPLTRAAYRILRPDRYGVFWFGFNYYGVLIESLELAGFRPNNVPFIWHKHTRSTENPNTRYANTYDAAIVASKGSPVFMRPGQVNLVEMQALTPNVKLQIAQQPIALPEKFILDMTSEGGIVVDLMAGSGTTGIAAVRNKREAILFEQELKACAIIEVRLNSLK